MHIAYISCECVPFSKTGGLADVAGALPEALCDHGHQVSVYTPYYRVSKTIDSHAQKIAEGTVPVGTEKVPYVVYKASISKGGATYYLIDNAEYFDREGLYGDHHGDYVDSCSRFIFFCRASMAAAQALGKPVDVYHCNDWSSALVAIYLKLSYANHPFHGEAASLFTIHNLSYQGLFWYWDWPLLNLPWKNFNWKELEFHGKMNLLKGALVHSDLLSTVSPTYADEIQTPEYGCGLEGVLSDRKADLFGVVNGIDTRIWNPQRDPLLPANFSAEDLTGKARCKAELLKYFKLPTDKDRPVIGMIGRLVEQKGFDIVALSIEELARRDVQLVFLGTGQDKYQAILKRMQELYPKQIGVALDYDNSLAHLIEAGSDIFLMPSKFEPCGLNQLYSLRYGTVPLVRKTGGLADTVVDATPENVKNGTASGFVFEAYTHTALLEATDRALDMLRKRPAEWRKLVLTGMKEDWSWTRSAKAYSDLYEKAKAKARTRKV